MRQQSSRPLTRKVALVGLAASLIGGLVLANDARGKQPTGGSEVAQKLIAWETFDRGQAERLAAEGQLVFVDVTADWCFTCKVNERLILETPETAEAFKRNEVVAMKADWTNRDDSIGQFLAEHGRYGIPFYALYRPGAAPHVFGELLTQRGLIDVIEASAERSGQAAAANTSETATPRATG